jgi:hypothetical protein
LGSKTGKNLAPLSYVIRTEDEPEEEDDDEPFGTEHERLIKTTPLSGKAYEHDNGKVWSIIKQLTLKSPAYDYISHLEASRDGRAAIKALISHYEGSTQIAKAISQAYEQIRTAEYSNERHHFTFEHYVHRHTSKALKTLEEYGEMISEHKKVSDFLNGVKSTDSNMLAGKAAVKSDEKYYKNFTECTNYLLNFIQTQPKGSAHNISSTDSNRNNKNKNNVNNNNKGKGGSKGKPQKQKLHSGGYPGGKWHSLTPEQKAEIKRLSRTVTETNATEPRATSSVARARPAANDDSSSDDNQNPGDQFATSNKKKAKRS